MGTGAERRRRRRLEEGALRDLQSTCCDEEVAKEISRHFAGEEVWTVTTSREGHVTELQLGERNISALPNSIGEFKALTAIDLFNNWERLITLPEGIGGLTALKRLTLDHCFAFASP